ncbi:hypothetical protein Tco_0676053 [Tanacetum coccineum]
MSSSESHATITYISISSAERSWSIPAMDPYEEAALHAPEQAPPSPDYVPGPNYVADSDLEEDPDNYPTDGRDDKEEDSSEDDDDEEEEDEHLALADSTLPVIDSIPSAEETEPFKTDELRRARISVRPYTPPSPSAEARIAEYAAAPTPPSPPPSPLSPWIDIPKAEMPPWKSACFTAPSHRFEIGESPAAAARQIEPALTHVVDYRFIDTVDASIQTSEGRVMTAIEEDNGLLQAHVSTLRRERQYHRQTAMLAESEARYAREAWSRSEGRSTALEQVMTLQTQHDRMEWQR